jgi:hypothetical protein
LVSEVVEIVGPIFIIVVLAAIYLAVPKFGPHINSRLTCPKCGKEFDYEWLPGNSFRVIRLGTKRYMACPLCKQWSTFDVVSTIVPPPKEEEENGEESENT